MSDNAQLCELVNGAPCDVSDSVEMPPDGAALPHVGFCDALLYTTADGDARDHEFDAAADASIFYVRPGVLLVVGHFDVNFRGITDDPADRG